MLKMNFNHRNSNINAYRKEGTFNKHMWPKNGFQHPLRLRNPFEPNGFPYYPRYNQMKHKKRQNFVKKKKLPEKPPSPLPGTEEYTNRLILEKSHFIKQQLNLASDNKTSNFSFVNSLDFEDETNTKRKDEAVIKEQSKKSMEIASNKKQKRLVKQSYLKESIECSEEEIYEKIFNFFAGLSHENKKKLINSDRCSYDIVCQQTGIKERAILNRVLRDFINQQSNNSNDFVNSSLDVSVTDLPGKLLNKLGIDVCDDKSILEPICNDNDALQSNILLDHIKQECNDDELFDFNRLYAKFPDARNNQKTEFVTSTNIKPENNLDECTFTKATNELVKVTTPVNAKINPSEPLEMHFDNCTQYPLSNTFATVDMIENSNSTALLSNNVDKVKRTSNITQMLKSLQEILNVDTVSQQTNKCDKVLNNEYITANHLAKSDNKTSETSSNFESTNLMEPNILSCVMSKPSSFQSENNTNEECTKKPIKIKKKQISKKKTSAEIQPTINFTQDISLDDNSFKPFGIVWQNFNENKKTETGATNKTNAPDIISSDNNGKQKLNEVSSGNEDNIFLNDSQTVNDIAVSVKKTNIQIEDSKSPDVHEKSSKLSELFCLSTIEENSTNKCGGKNIDLVSEGKSDIICNNDLTTNETIIPIPKVRIIQGHKKIQQCKQKLVNLTKLARSKNKTLPPATKRMLKKISISKKGKDKTIQTKGNKIFANKKQENKQKAVKKSKDKTVQTDSDKRIDNTFIDKIKKQGIEQNKVIKQILQINKKMELLRLQQQALLEKLSSFSVLDVLPVLQSAENKKRKFISKNLNKNLPKRRRSYYRDAAEKIELAITKNEPEKTENVSDQTQSYNLSLECEVHFKDKLLFKIPIHNSGLNPTVNNILSLNMIETAETNTGGDCIQENVPLGKSSDVESHSNKTVKKDFEVEYEGFSGNISVIKVLEKQLLAGSTTGFVYFFEIQSGKLLETIDVTESPVTSFITLENNLTNFYVGTHDTVLRIYKYSNKELISTVQLNEGIQCMDFSWNYIFIGSCQGSIIRYNIQKKKIEFTSKISDQSVLAIKTAQEGPRRVLLVGLRDSNIYVRDAISGLPMRNLSQENERTIYSICLSNNHVYCGTNESDVFVYRFSDGKCLSKFHTASSRSVAFIEILDNLLFAGSYNSKIYVFDIKMNTLLDCLTGPEGILLAMKIFEDKIIVSTKSHFKAWTIPIHCLKHS